MLIPIRRGERFPAVFGVHSSTGGVAEFVTLAQQLDDGQQFFGLQSRGLLGGPRPVPTVPEMARDYLGQVRRVQPVGPYLFAAWSMGGYVAVEMARQAAERGDRVGGVFLIAPPHDDRYGPWRRWTGWRAARKVLRNLDDRIGAEPAEAPPGRELLPLWDLDEESLPDPLDDGVGLLSAEDRQRLRVERTNLVNVWAGIRYRARLRRRLRPYDLRVVLFVPRDDPARERRDAVAQWRGALRTEPEVVSVPGGHGDVLVGPGARLIGARLRAEVARW
ncbi:alpha/beta fold hydrolase [Micromonospora sp. HM5-17]|uniref:alpha/beta fold hydrolase n=1 Tax=Micromonospora sp. HM5-17 TaxID=2487710 RepID=UPI0011CD8040|nr:alpha/beta fold hydrolase [Micromonospora sp. HM5-17]